MYSLQIVAIFNKTTKSDSVLAFERENVLEKSNESLSSVLCNSESMSEHCSSNKINFTDAKVGFQVMKSKCPDKLIMGHLNINSIRNKFDALSLIFKNNVDILMISETKLDDSHKFCFMVSVQPIDLKGNRKLVELCCILGKIYHLGFLIVNLKLVLKLFLLKLI